MTTEKMTVHEALCELKTLDSRIDKAIQKYKFIFANKHSNTKVQGVNISEHCNEIKSAYQSATDLISRRDAIKRAVTLSNAKEMVAIGDREYTIAEAIELKNHGIPILEKLLAKLTQDNKSARFEAEQNNGAKLEERADVYISSMYLNKDMKDITSEMKKSREEFIAAQTMELIDPIGIESEMKKLSERIDTFKVKVDSALSVSNALTQITVEY